MDKLGLNEIRERFLKFFEGKGHLRMRSFPLIPQNDQSLLLINSGMAPLKPYFTGQEIPPRKRVTTCQKCIRTDDIENVGKTERHGTVFEMLGNFSFGDYFKEEVIPWAWEFITEDLKIPKDKLYVSIFEDDDEAFEIWNKKVGIAAERIYRLGREDNFWEVGLGPCGPCSEIHYDRGEENGCGKPDCQVGCDCDRFIEIWNLVFTQFYKNEDDSYSKLSSPNIDTGMGLDRVSLVMQNVNTIFDIDTIKAVRDHVCKIAGITYTANKKDDISVRIITDHIRAVTFMASDGVIASNEGRGYVLRRLLRRAARHGKLLGIKHTFLTELSKTAIEVSKGAYPELEEKRELILKLVSSEETRFYTMLDAGMEILKDALEKFKQNKAAVNKILTGDIAFKLYDTYGFPIELMKEILVEEGFDIDEAAFQKEMDEQRNKARSAREVSNYMGAEETVYHKLDVAMSSEFAGYSKTEMSGAKVLAVVAGNEILEKGLKAEKDTDVSVILDITPFYAESGGQKGDKGVIKTPTGTVTITDTIKVVGNKIAHVGTVTEGFITNTDTAEAIVDSNSRMDTARNHTATHLLQKALREVLGKHVEQAGSYVSSERLRFDFTHFSAISADELMKIENIVNEKIMESLAVEVSEKDIDTARSMGAMALFGEKYGKTVRVVDISGYSIELCGGTHLTNTVQVGTFKILSESGIAAGTRRIEAVTGRNALIYYRELEQRLSNIGSLVKSSTENLIGKLTALVEESREQRQEIERLKSKLSDGIIEDILTRVDTYGEFKVITEKVKNIDINGMRAMGDKLKDKIKSGAVILAGINDSAVNFIVMATDDIVKAGANAGAMVKEAAALAGGTGGGRPNMAQAGAKQPDKADEALNKAKEVLKKQLGL